MSWDVIVVGAGSAGCALAGRLALDPNLRVLLVEAGPTDAHPLIHMPKGMARLLTNPRYSYAYRTEWKPDGSNHQEILLRGRGIGGSSNVNGMVYHRGQPQDYDEWEALGLPGWGWQDMLACFRAIENNPLPANDWRGPGGPLNLRVASELPPLAEAIIDAAGELGLPHKEEPNLPAQLGISATSENIDARGRRVSAATAFLTPAVRRQGNLRLMPNTRIDRILFEGRRAAGIACTQQGRQIQLRATKEVVLCTGTLESPRILQISGIGPAKHLKDLGIDVVVDSPGVGSNYRDHYCLTSRWRLRSHEFCENRQYQGLRLFGNALRYFLLGAGPLTAGACQMAVFPEVLPGNTGRPDAELVYNPYSLSTRAAEGNANAMESEPGCFFNGFPLRGTSTGTVMASSSNPADPPRIAPNYLATDYDRAVTVGLFHFIKRLMTHEKLKPFVVAEDGPDLKTDEEIVDYVRATGNSGYHSIGTCKMGPKSDPNAVVDAQLRVRNVEGLRVADCSVMPLQLSANTNGPAMAIGWKLAEMMKSTL